METHTCLSPWCELAASRQGLCDACYKIALRKVWRWNCTWEMFEEEGECKRSKRRSRPAPRKAFFIALAIIGNDTRHWPDTMDASAWARAWMLHVKESPSLATDEDTMIGWFANAIMAGFDDAKRRAKESHVSQEGAETP